MGCRHVAKARKGAANPLSLSQSFFCDQDGGENMEPPKKPGRALPASLANDLFRVLREGRCCASVRGTVSPRLSQAPWRSLYREPSHVSYRLVMAKATRCFSISNSPPLISLRVASPHLIRNQNVDTFPQIWFLKTVTFLLFSPSEETSQDLSYTFCADCFSDWGSGDVFTEQDKLSLVLIPPPEIPWDGFTCYPRVKKVGV